ncbi:hypothetical protein NLJ89_g3523 [Agrocybe chaxingu]|uniref:Protein CPL1-like domain-containing protein n=1 Tax=Agrocybe chaxingu TaxID=84603 RepID=A0A9W8K4G1_9AGAR|nr:hypothetical protein NLJ89_g3523 [Agrocybe chaxingu]
MVASTYTSSNQQNCKGNQFWCVAGQKCCLDKGGPKTPPAPPKGTNCPPTSYYWEPKRGCCVPRNPPPTNPPPPQCPKNWTWYPAIYKCLPTPTPPTPPPSTPSKYNGGYNNHGYNNHGYGYGYGGHKKRSANLTGDYECLDTATELESCGGCTSQGKGQDCTKIEGAWNVGCEQGSCVVYTCAGGFQIGLDGKTCVEL